ncbi:MAG: histidine kinase [Arenimonas sp.]|jgi:signal transduction histidine kinase
MTSVDKHKLAVGLPVQTFPIGSVDARMIDVMRCILALSALAIGYVDSGESLSLVALSRISAFAYLVWSAVSLFLATRRSLLRPPRHEHWVDVLFAALLLALTQGSSSVYFFIFLFAILVASFSRGFSEGLRVTCVSVVLFELAVLWFAPGAGTFDLDRTLVRPFFLLALGSMIAYWGGHEITHRRRLRLLQEINNQWNPRFGHDHAIGTNLERALEFFSAGACILVLKRPTTPPIYLTYHTSGRKRGQAMLPSTITQETAAILLSFPANFSARYEETPRGWRRWFARPRLTSRDEAMTEQCEVLANLLDTTSFLTVPYVQRDGTEGRAFLTAGKRSFDASDVDFFAQLMTTISNVVEGMQLMDELVSRAAEHERYRISLDIHDTTVQPYIGLKLGLDALAREAGPGNPLSRRIGELLGMTDNTIRDLRRYMTTLQDDTTLGGDSLLSAVRDQASHYHRFYGIEVEVRCDGEVQVNSQLAGALLQIVAEGLSNILRHTTAKRAHLTLHREGQTLVLEIANESPGDESAEPVFTPRSISARTRSLGGRFVVERGALGYTIVRIVIPL